MKLTPLILLSTAWTLTAAEWPGWRGAEQDGSVAGEKPPAKFSAEENLLWKAALPGRGCSTPIVVDGKIILTSEIEGKDGVIAYDMEGKELWRKTFGKIIPGRGQRVGSSANSSPVTDGEAVYVYFKSGQLAALELSGDVRWEMNLFKKFGEDKLWWDVGTSPVIAGGNLVVAMMQTDAPSYIVSLDRKTGNTVWKNDRHYETGPESGDSYTTPLVYDIDGKETLVCWGGDHLTGQDVATGEILWTVGGFNPDKKKGWRVIASAVASGDVALVPYARGEYVAGVKMGGKGDTTEKAHLWKHKLGSDSATPAADDGKFYILTDRGPQRGLVTCIDAPSGKVLWKDKLPKAAQTFYASPIIAGGLLVCPREDGVVLTAKIGKEGLEEIKSNELGEGVIASPVVVDGQLLLRGDRSLFCFAN
ncbi:PQQ-binding-like beta-propeller repeat protein [Haloferula chungangensis]|uniref:PQQ-binding-like beta-propeller repeat protein n=1 Tax=Haloferula chungangensis TaxID=1048331 RepID=A0ABW2LED9_9BACT